MVRPFLCEWLVHPTRPTPGQWWFDAAIFDSMENAYSRLYFQSAQKDQVISSMMQEVLAISTEWNTRAEVWVLELPTGQALTGFVGSGKSSKTVRRTSAFRQGKPNALSARQVRFTSRLKTHFGYGSFAICCRSRTRFKEQYRALQRVISRFGVSRCSCGKNRG